MNHSLDINLIPDDYVLVIPIDDEVKKNDNTNSGNQSDTE